jgi:pyruvate dehydrogenase E1 component alpha subunit
LPRFAANPAEVVKMYEAMTRVRVFDQGGGAAYRATRHLSAVGTRGHAYRRRRGDAAGGRPGPVYREFGTQLWRGVTMTEILVYWGGDERGNDFAGPRHDFLGCPSPLRPCTRPERRWRSKCGVNRCALAYIGDGGTSEGAFYEALNLAERARCRWCS